MTDARGKRLGGITLMGISFFGAACVSVRVTDAAGSAGSTIPWGWYGTFLVAGIAGILLLRISGRGHKHDPRQFEANLVSLESSLTSLLGKLSHLNTNSETLGVCDVHERIDAELVADMGTFIEAREALPPSCGWPAYADIMSQFAGAERSINRARSTSVDGQIDQLWECLGTAESQIAEACELLESHRQRV